MTNQAAIRERIAAAEQRAAQARQEAATAELARQEAETAPARAVALAERELASLRQLARQQEIAEAQRQYQALVSQFHQRINDLIAALDKKVDLPVAQTAWDDATSLFQQIEALRTSAPGGPRWTPAERERYQQLLNDPAVQERARLVYQPVEVFASQLVDSERPAQPGPVFPALNPQATWQQLSNWIALARSQTERRHRVGFVYAVTGRLLDNAIVGMVSGNPAPHLMR